MIACFSGPIGLRRVIPSAFCFFRTCQSSSSQHIRHRIFLHFSLCVVKKESINATILLYFIIFVKIFGNIPNFVILTDAICHPLTGHIGQKSINPKKLWQIIITAGFGLNVALTMAVPSGRVIFQVARYFQAGGKK